MDENLKIIITTHDDALQARQLARTLVENKAAACVNILPNLTSIFTWDGATQVESEHLLLIKTTPEKVGSVRRLIESNHTYDVPEILKLDGEVLHKPYMDWVRECLLG